MKRTAFIWISILLLLASACTPQAVATPMAPTETPTIVPTGTATTEPLTPTETVTPSPEPTTTTLPDEFVCTYGGFTTTVHFDLPEDFEQWNIRCLSNTNGIQITYSQGE